MKIFIAYFSWSGHTKHIAENIQNYIGGDLCEIKPLKPYPHDHNSASRMANITQGLTIYDINNPKDLVNWLCSNGLQIKKGTL